MIKNRRDDDDDDRVDEESASLPLPQSVLAGAVLSVLPRLLRQLSVFAQKPSFGEFERRRLDGHEFVVQSPRVSVL